MKFESTKDTENPLKGMCLYNKPSDGISFRWGSRGKIMKISSKAEISNALTEKSIRQSESSDGLLLIPLESPDNIDEKTSPDSRNLIQRKFTTSKHKKFFESVCDKRKSSQSLSKFSCVLIYPHIFLCKDISDIINDLTKILPKIIKDEQSLLPLLESYIILGIYPKLFVIDMGMDLGYISKIRKFEADKSLKRSFILGIYDKHIRNPLGLADEYSLDDFASKVEIRAALENLIKTI